MKNQKELTRVLNYLVPLSDESYRDTIKVIELMRKLQHEESATESKRGVSTQVSARS